MSVHKFASTFFKEKNIHPLFLLPLANGMEMLELIIPT